jgi:hypothetical protein
MLPIELPRALEEYFAYAETEPTRRGRRFSISLPFYRGDQLDRLQWWYHVSAAEEAMFDGEGLAVFRARATERFRRHIERWLVNTHQRMYGFGEDAIPRISAASKVERFEASERTELTPPTDRKVVNG